MLIKILDYRYGTKKFSLSSTFEILDIQKTWKKIPKHSKGKTVIWHITHKRINPGILFT